MEAIVTAAVAVLTAFVKASGESISDELGKKIGGLAWKRARELFQTVSRKLRARGKETVEALTKQPDDPDVQAMVRYHLRECLKTDEMFKRKISELLRQDDERGSSRVFETSITGNIQQLNQINQVRGIGIVHAGVFVQHEGSSKQEASLEQGISLMDAGFYDQADEIFRSAMVKHPNQANLYYYAALSLLGGGRPDALIHEKAQRIKQHLSKACQLDRRQAHYYYLWAVVQFGFFETKGFDGSPGTHQLLEWALESSINPEAISQLVKYLPPMQDNPAYEALVKSESCSK